MAQQTAVDIFYEQIDDIIPDALRERIELFKEQAKEMEKQHKEAFWIAGLVYALKVLKTDENANSKEAFEQYYNETYNK